MDAILSKLQKSVEPEDRAKYYALLLRKGEITEDEIALKGYCGDAGAKLLGYTKDPSLLSWLIGLHDYNKKAFSMLLLKALKAIDWRGRIPKSVTDQLVEMANTGEWNTDECSYLGERIATAIYPDINNIRAEITNVLAMPMVLKIAKQAVLDWDGKDIVWEKL